MNQVFKIFFHTGKTKPWLVLICLLLASVSEVLGIATLLPAGFSIIEGQQDNPSMVTKAVNAVFSFIDITPTFGNFLFLAMVLLFAKALLSFGALVYAGITGAQVTINLRRRLINALFNARWSYYAEKSSGQLANTISSDTSRAGDAYTYSAVTISFMIELVAYLIAAFLIDWQVALSGIVAGAIVLALTNKLVAITRNESNKTAIAQSQFVQDTVDMLSNIKPLKTMERYDALVSDLSFQLRRMKRAVVRLHVAQQALSNGSDVIVASMIGLGAYFLHVISNKSLNEMMITGLIFYQVIHNLTRFQKQRNNMGQIENAYIRSMEMIDAAEGNRENHNGTLPAILGAGCKFENVNFQHADKPTVRDLNFYIPAGKITVFQGPSGAGKTTIIDLLIGLNIPQSGNIYIGQDKLTAVDVKSWRRQIGYVPQELMLFHDTIRANVSLSDPNVTEADIHVAIAKAGATEFITDLTNGIDSDVGEMGTKLSGGQRQRISLARALAKNPKILILDEVTSALDPATEKEIINNILALHNEYTVIAITHRPAWTEIADRVYVVQDGKIKTSPRKVKS